MKKFNKRIIVAIMCLVMLFANNSYIQADEDYSAEDVWNYAMSECISYDYGFVGKDGSYTPTPILILDTEKIAEKYPGAVECIDDTVCITNSSGQKYEYTMACCESEGKSLGVLPLDGIDFSKKTASDGSYEVIHSGFGDNGKTIYYVSSGAKFDTDINHGTFYWEASGNGTSKKIAPSEIKEVNYYDPSNNQSNENNDQSDEDNSQSIENFIDDQGRLYFKTSKEGAFEAYLIIDGEKEYPTVYFGDGSPVNVGAWTDWDKLYSNVHAFIGQENSSFFIYVTEEQVASGAQFECVKVGENYGTMLDGDNPGGNAVDNSEKPNIFEKAFSFFIRLMGLGINKLISIIAGEKLTIDSIVFDQYSRIQLTFFTNDFEVFSGNASTKQPNSLLSGALEPLSDVFSLFRNIALIAYMIILVYLGIRVLLFSTAERQSKYKEVLVDWIKGIAILFLFPYVIRYTILLNHGLVTYIAEKSKDFLTEPPAAIQSSGGTLASTSGGGDVDTSDGSYMSEMYEQSKDGWLAPTICWFIMLIQVVQFLIVYMKRLITVMFLIAIFPLVSISYALDKIADGKSQAFNSWCKEFILQVFIQSFHAINYVLVMGIICNLSPENWILKIIGISYVAKGGDIIKSMFAQVQGTKGGGPLEVARTLAATKVAIGSVKSLKKFASNTFGKNSVLGKGRALIGSARNSNIERAYTKSVRQRDEAFRANQYLLSPTGSAIPREPLSDEKAKEYMNDVLDGSTRRHDDDYKRKVDALARMDPEDVRRLANEMGLSERSQRNLEYLLDVAMATEIVNGARRGQPSVDVKRSIDILIKERQKNNSIATRYLNESNLPSDDVLRGMAVANSIVVDEDSARGRAPLSANATQEERVRYALDTFKSGSVGIKEMHEQFEIIKAARTDPTLNRMIEETENNELGYKFNEDFELNLYAQTVNNSNSAEVYTDQATRDLVDKSIEKLQEANSKTNKTVTERQVLSNVNTRIDELQVGEIPELIDREQERNRQLQQELESQLTELQQQFRDNTGVELDIYDFLDKGQEYDTYLANRERELTKNAIQDATKGVVTTLVGAKVSTLKIGYGSVTAGVMAGASMEGKNDPITDLVTNIPAGYNLVDEVSGKVGGVVTRPISAIDRRLTEDRVSTDVSRRANEINEEFYTREANNSMINSQISQAEAERNALLRRLNKRIAEDNRNANP